MMTAMTSSSSDGSKSSILLLRRSEGCLPLQNARIFFLIVLSALASFSAPFSHGIPQHQHKTRLQSPFVPSSTPTVRLVGTRNGTNVNPVGMSSGDVSELPCGDDVSITTTTTATTIEGLMAEYDPILLFASRFLPSNIAVQDAGALYAWCRRLDEICDNPAQSNNPEAIQNQLDIWEYRFEKLWDGHPVDEMDAALSECIIRQGATNKKGSAFILTKDPFQDMIAGMRADAVVGDKRRIANLPELEDYAYQVAGTVGIMLLPLLDAPSKAKEPAICLGKAIQLINILRDAKPDIVLGRIYLPQDLLKSQNIREEDIFTAAETKKVPGGYKSVVKMVSSRAEELLQKAEEGKDCLPGLGPLLVQIIIELYRNYLLELAKRDYDNLTPVDGEERVKITKYQKAVSVFQALQKIYFS